MPRRSSGSICTAPEGTTVAWSENLSGNVLFMTQFPAAHHGGRFTFCKVIHVQSDNFTEAIKTAVLKWRKSLWGALMTNAALADLYGDSISSIPLTANLASRCSSPLLLMAPDGWKDASRRLVIVGQETFGWGDSAIPRSLEDIRSSMQGYTEFSFAKNHPAHRNSPFWRAFRQLAMKSEAEVLWTNLLRFDIDGGSVLRNCRPDELKALLAAQHGILEREIEVLDPHAVVFFTGPNYDRILLGEFPSTKFEPIDDYPARQFARINADGLPRTSFRTYHPGYLNRSGRWDWLNRLSDLIVADLRK